MEGSPKMAGRVYNPAYLSELEVLERKVYPLMGATGRPPIMETDTRFRYHAPLEQRNVTFYEHLATLRHRPSNDLFVVYRQTRDAKMLEERDPVLYPMWVMDSQAKQMELAVYVEKVRCLPSLIPNLTSQRQWLDPIEEDWKWDTLLKFLVDQNIVNENMLRKS